MSFGILGNSLHALSDILHLPVIFCLLVFAAAVVIETGSVIAEGLFERRSKKPDAALILSSFQSADEKEIKDIICSTNLLGRQKKSLLKLWDYRMLNPAAGHALATQLLSEQEHRCRKIVLITDYIVKLAPMLGLMGTLIPLGPGMIALGQGDIKTLAVSLISAFDTTIAGLATGGISFILSKLRKLWYEKDLAMLETLINGLLEVMYGGEKQ